MKKRFRVLYFLIHIKYLTFLPYKAALNLFGILNGILH